MSRRQRISQFLTEFEALRSGTRVKIVGQIESLLAEFGSLRSDTTLRRPARFNLLELTGIGGNEVRHSSIIAWLLDANSGHGQRDLFFRAFLSSCGIEGIAGTSPYAVRTEETGLQARTDLVAYRPQDFLIFIENKVFAAEGPDQLLREARDMERLAHSLRVPLSRRFLVFLSPGGREPLTAGQELWQTLSYAELAAAMTAALGNSVAPKLDLFVREWAELVNTWEA